MELRRTERARRLGGDPRLELDGRERDKGRDGAAQTVAYKFVLLAKFRSLRDYKLSIL